MKSLLLGLLLVSSPVIAGMKNQDVNCRVSIKSSTFDGEDTITKHDLYLDLGVSDVVSKDNSSRIKSKGEKTAAAVASTTLAENGLEIMKNNFSISKSRFLANKCNGVKFQDHFKGTLRLSKKELKSVIKLVYPEINSSKIRSGISISDKTSYECYGPESVEVEIEKDKKYLELTMSCGAR